MLAHSISANTPDTSDPAYWAEEAFHDSVRVQIICLIVYVFFYLLSYYVIRYYKTRSDNDELYSGPEDFLVYRIAVWICTSSLAISLASVCLLPFSILGTEIRGMYVDNFYVAWLNWDLIYTMWNYVFALSNLSIFILLPFAYFFIESQGFYGAKKRLKSRIIEAATVSFLLIFTVTCLIDLFYTSYFAKSIPNHKHNSTDSSVWKVTQLHLTLLNFTTVNIPLVYSFCSLIGLGLFLISTPFGFSKIFDYVYTLLIQQQNINVIHAGASIAHHQPPTHFPSPPKEGGPLSSDELNGKLVYLMKHQSQNVSFRMHTLPFTNPKIDANENTSPNPSLTTDCSNGTWQVPKSITSSKMMKVVRICQRSLNVIKYPFLLVAILSLTGLFVSMITINTLKLLFGFRSLPVYVQFVEVNSRHAQGVMWAMIEVMVITYMFVTSLAGIYNLPFLRKMKPIESNTSMTSVIGNSTLILCLSSALPVTSKTLGITTFDLLGTYGTLTWLSNFQFVWFYNVIFVAVTIACLLNKLTAQVRNELMSKFQYLTGYKPYPAKLD
uniref:LMBR1-like membrane protein n=1 Tax=Rhabditophanes sp. KR3021 TaxID=114890 RepID=A0AC35U1J1_9BILA